MNKLIRWGTREALSDDELMIYGVGQTEDGQQFEVDFYVTKEYYDHGKVVDRLIKLVQEFDIAKEKLQMIAFLGGA